MDEIERMKQTETQKINESEAEEKQKLHESMRRAEIKKSTILFMIVASVVEIIVTLVILVALYLVAALLIFKVFNAKNAGVFEFMYPVIFIGGMFLGFMLYKKVMQWAIKKWNLRDKIRPDVLDHYLTKKELLEKKGRE